MIDIFSNLNGRQTEAVKATEGRIKVVAGAGSGKTRVLAHRYAHLVNNLGIDPANILCTTFTNKAAREMRQRISKMVAAGNANDFVCTIHGLCVKILRRDIYRMGWPATFTILDESDTELISKQVLELHNLDRTKKSVSVLLEAVADFKRSRGNGFISEFMLPQSPQFVNTEGFGPVESFIHYQALNYCLNFDDILAFALYLLDNFTEVREHWQDKLNYIMVDEAQDCNASDWTIVETMAAKYGNLFIVGDPDQAIYEWRGARPEMFVDWECNRLILLDQNYRSTPNILDVANSIIANNKQRIPKDLYTRRDAMQLVTHFHAKNDAEEAKWIADRIEEMVAQGNTYSDFAILFRASHQSRSLEQELLRRELPYVIWGGVRFFDRKEVKDALSYLRLIANDADNLSFARIVNTPSRAFGATSLKKIQQLSENSGRSNMEELRRNLELWKGKKAYRPLKAFISLIEQCRSIMPVSSVSELLNYTLKESGLTRMLRDDPETERLENIDELLSSIRLYEEQHAEDGDLSLIQYLQEVALYTNADYQNDNGCIKLMTVHQSKGLEFPCVFIIGLSEGAFPSHKSLRERKKKALEEERRLMYVAVTRAEDRLYLTEAEGFNVQSHSEKFPSRFLREIKEQFLIQEGDLDPTVWEGSEMAARAIDCEIMPPPRQEIPFAVGSRVLHEYLGIGEVIEISPDGSKAKVRFGADERSDRYISTSILKPLAN